MGLKPLLGPNATIPLECEETDEIKVENWEEISLMHVPANKDAVVCLEDIGEWEIVPGSVESPE